MKNMNENELLEISGGGAIDFTADSSHVVPKAVLPRIIRMYHKVSIPAIGHYVDSNFYGN